MKFLQKQTFCSKHLFPHFKSCTTMIGIIYFSFLVCVFDVTLWKKQFPAHGHRICNGKIKIKELECSILHWQKWNHPQNGINVTWEACRDSCDERKTLTVDLSLEFFFLEFFVFAIKAVGITHSIWLTNCRSKSTWQVHILMREKG